MARYIDADRLSKQILDSWDNNNHRTIQASQVHSQEHQHLMRMIEKQPTADVVPKSEVDLYRKQVDELEDELASTYDKLEKAKADVAKIFAEIERVIGEKYELYVFDDREIEGLKQDAIITFADAMTLHFAELKNKYTKGE